MERIVFDDRERGRRFLHVFRTFLFLSLWTLSATAKMATDFTPNMDFSKFKAFAYIGGVEQHIRLQLNPDLLNNRFRRSVARELTAKGLREVKPEENRDLVVRYWIESETYARMTGS